MDQIQFCIYKGIAQAIHQGIEIRNLCIVARPKLAEALLKHKYILPLPIKTSERIPENEIGDNVFSSDLLIVHKRDAHLY